MTFNPVRSSPSKACCDDVECAKHHAGPGACDMRKKAVFNRVVLRAMRRIMRYTNRNVDPVDQSLQVFLENVMTTVIASSAVAQQQNRLGVGVRPLAVPLPPHAEAVASELTRVVTDCRV